MNARAPKALHAISGILDRWLRLQTSLAEKTGIALSVHTPDGALLGSVDNDNSICSSMDHSPEVSPICAGLRAEASSEAIAANCTVEFKCHAGLHCFAIPVTIDNAKMIIMGGKVFTSTAEYTEFMRKHSDEEGVSSGAFLKNVKFVDFRDYREAIELVESTAEWHFRSTPRSEPREDDRDDVVRFRERAEEKSRSIGQFNDFLRSVASSLDSQRVYPAVLAKFGELMKARRSSLMILNEESNELALEAAVGLEPEPAVPVRVKLGEGVAGAVIATGSAMLVGDADTDARVPKTKRGRYRSKSFISFPISIGGRNVGVINLTDRYDGSVYDGEDLSLLEAVSPHLALIVDRTEWRKKAETYQRMSLTDPLTGLPNRRYLQERLFEEVERSKRHSTPLSFMIIDVDRFKGFNDIYGHTNADRVLVRTAQILRASVRAIDTSARFAGDEFCIVLPETEIEDAARIAERLRTAVSRTEYISEQGELMGRVTISVGVSSFSPLRQSPLAVIETADRALYRAKTLGRNSVVVYEDSI